MTDDPTLLLHAVLDNPGDDAPRAMLADCLMEHGETEFHRYYGRFIACQLAGEYFQEKLWSDTLVGPAALHMEDYAFQMWPRWGDALTPVTYHRNLSGYSLSPATILHFNRGFIRAAEMTIDEFLRLAVVLFRRHPIEEVRIRKFGFGLGRRDIGVRRLYVNNVPSTQLEGSTNIFYLPVGFKNLLKGGRLVYFNSYGDREYDTETEALADLSQACVAFAYAVAHERRHYELVWFPESQTH